MINRTLVRTKVVQTLYAYFEDNEKTPATARKELLGLFADTYSLYMILLAFANELTNYAEEQIHEAKTRAAILHKTYTPNYKFVNSPVARHLFNNARLRNYLNEQHLSWDTGMEAVQSVYKQLQDSPFYIEYMLNNAPTYEDDKALWRKIYAALLPGNEALQTALEEMEVTLDKQGWATDADLILTYVVKTVKRFKEERGDEQELLDMFDTEEELSFAKDLLQHSITHADEYRTMINATLQNWDASRLARMDTVIMITALAEILNFNEIALEVSMNEYIEIAKEYSSDKSYIFINGVLDKVTTQLRRQNRLFKVVR